jgi:NAD(P)-dependent dehydrogenase (short-subunit alcohol dehydrogenase family)
MTTPSLIRPESVVLVSGGAKGITAQCVIRLAEQTGCRFILAGRSALADTEPAWAQGTHDAAELKRRIMDDQKANGQSPTPQTIQRAYQALVSQREIQATLDAVRNAGAQAVYISADVTDTDDLRRKLAPAVEQLGPVTGILHGAGSLADKRIENKTLADYKKVFNPKVKGLERLLSCVPADQLQFVVLFSSVAGFYGNVGQADYALANEILNKTAYRLQRQYPDCRVISINWGPWEAGMVTPELKKAFAAQNIKMIPVDVGTEILAGQLTGPGPVPTQIVVGSPVSRPAAPVTDNDRIWHIERSLRLADNPFLQDHRIGGNPVLPATCGTSWMIHACEQLFPGYVFSQMQDYRVLKGIVFEDQEPRKYTLDVKLVVSPSSDALQLEATIWSHGPNGRPRFHYRAGITLVKSLPEPVSGTPFSAAELANPAAIEGHTLYSDGTLFHGPAFQGVQRVLTMSQEHIHMENFLPALDARIQGQFPARSINPFLNDAVVQALLIWSMQYDQAPCLPASLERLENYCSMSFGETYHVDLQIRSHSATSVVGDLLVQDAAGKPYIRFVGLEGTISKQLTRYIGKGQPVDQVIAPVTSG